MQSQNIIKKFEEWKMLFDKDVLEEFTTNLSGILWLKIKSIVRKEFLQDFIVLNKLNVKATKSTDIFKELYILLSKNIDSGTILLDEYIRSKSTQQIKLLNETLLVNELYKLQTFHWGGDYKNALDKHLVDKYIKIYEDYDTIISKLDTSIQVAVRGYVLCSWYNHWSSILIENIFKKHPKVLPTVGQIKKVDFFIDNIPFDLKVTYLPENFIEKQRKSAGLKPELTVLKQTAKAIGLYYGATSKSELYDLIVAKLTDSKSDLAEATLTEIKNFRMNLIESIKQNPKELILNLYEEQGELRFDASNRLFLLLVDTNLFSDSWKLKRNTQELYPVIQQYLDQFNVQNIEKLRVDFTYKDKGDFSAFSDLIIVTK